MMLGSGCECRPQLSVVAGGDDVARRPLKRELELEAALAVEEGRGSSERGSILCWRCLIKADRGRVPEF